MSDFVGKHKKIYYLALLFIIIYSFMDIVKSLLIEKIYDSVSMVHTFYTILIQSCIFIMTFVLVMMIQQYLVEVLKNKIRYTVNKQLYKEYLSINFLNEDSSEIIHRFQNEVTLLIDQYVSAKLNMYYLIVSFCFGSFYVGFLSVEVLVFLYICGITTLSINKLCKHKLSTRQEMMLQSQQEWIQGIKNICSNFKVMKLYSLESKFTSILDHKNQEVVNKILEFNGFLKIISAMNAGISQIMFFGTLLFGVWLINKNILTIGSLLGIVQASNMVINPILNYMNLFNNIVASKSIVDKLKIKSEKQNQDDNHCIDKEIDVIELKDLTVAYQDENVFEHVNLILEKGKKYLIVGESGCGKTTLLNLLTKQIDSSRVFINGLALDKISFSSYMKHIAYVTQQSDLLPFTLHENISLGRKKSKYSIEELLVKLNLKMYLEDNNKIYNNKNQQMSCGQLQRIHIARALYGTYDWLFLDEAFSSIDEQNAKMIERFILSEKDSSIVAISHKLSKDIVSLYDEVLVVENKTITPISTNKFIKMYMN